MVLALHKFHQLGLPVKLVEAGSDFGGVSGTGTAIQVQELTPNSQFYQLSIPEVYKTFNFNERFPSHDELRGYFQHMSKVLDLKKDAIFNTIVEGVTWNKKWTCRTKDDIIITCRYLILCTGSSYKKHLPPFKGLEKFSGELIHSAAFPEKGVDVKGKRVAVIGNGSTGVQIIQELAKEDCSLTAFIRTPIIALPMKQRGITSQEQDSLRSFYNTLLKAGRACKTGFPYNTQVKSFSETTDKEREDLFLRFMGARRFFLAFSFFSNFAEFVTDKGANECIFNFWAKKTRARVRDPVKRDIVAPLKQEHYFGVKRPSLEQDYYEAIDRSNVELVNLKRAPICEITEEGIMTDKLHKFDTIILATGYYAMTGSLMDLWIRDKKGLPLQEKWTEVETYLGLMITGMPNMFMVYSPQAPTALSNGPPIIESQVDWIIDAIQKMKSDGIIAIEPQREMARKWGEDIQAMNGKTLYPLENSWYMGANIPGK